MKIGIPLEIMTGEGRVALTPNACQALTSAGHQVFVQAQAGNNSDFADAEYQQTGAEILLSAELLYESAELIVKVKQPLVQDIALLQSHHVLFCYLHLAADPTLVQILCASNITAIPFESLVDESGQLPLLAPMSQVAGRIATIRGASLLFRNRGGRGVLLGGIDGADAGRVVILGVGVAGSHALAVAVALGAKVDVLDVDASKLAMLKQQYPAIETHLSTAESVAELCVKADLVIGAVLLAGRRAPVVLMQSVVKQMNTGSVIVDIAIDQGGCVEGIRATSSEQLSYIEHGVIHSAVPNMPATVSRTASQSLSNAILPYLQQLTVSNISSIARSQQPPQQAMQTALHKAVAIHQGSIVDAILQAEVEPF